MNNKAHLRPQDYDSNGDIIPTIDDFPMEIVAGKCPIEADGNCPLKQQGEWVKIGEIGLAYTCNKCGEVNVIPTKFCPNCGLPMKKGGAV